MIETEQLLRSSRSLLLVDWPSRDVPDTLALAGFAVFVKGGPEPDSYSAHQLNNGEVVVRWVGLPPEQADIVYSHRPLEELGGIVAMATEAGAKAIWCQSGLAGPGAKDVKGCWVPEDKSREARAIVESAGLAYVDDVYIADAVRHLDVTKP